MHFLNRSFLGIGLSVVAVAAQAQDATFEFNIPAQPVHGALKALSAQSGLQLSYVEQHPGAVHSPGVRGRHTVREALAQVLSGTGLMFTWASDKWVTIKPVSASLALAPITVTATRMPRRVDQVAASVSVLGASDLAAKQRQNVYEALRDVEGLDFGYAASVAHQVAPTIRGVGGSFAGSTTQVLVDGMGHDSVVSSLLGHGGLNFTSVQDVERVEVVRGPVSALYGPGVIGGVVNVIPKRWKGDAGVEVHGAYGSHNTRVLGVAAGTSGATYDVRVSAYDARSDGFVAIPVRDKWGQLDHGPRDWADRKLGVLAGFRPASNQEWTLSAQSFATRSAALGGRPNERHDLDGDSATLSYRHELSETTAVKASVRLAHLKQRYSFDEEDWNGDEGNLARAYDGARANDSSSFLVQMDTRPLAGNQLIVGYSHDTGDYETRGTPVGGASSVSGSKDKVDAVFVQDEQRLGAWLLSGGLRYDRLDFSADTVNGVPKNGSASVDNVVTPRLGARYLLSEAASLYATVGRGYLPALNAFKFVQPSSSRVDNPNLDPETSTTYEFGASTHSSWGQVRASLYHTDYKNKIALGTDAASGKRQWQNIAQVRVDGLELAYEGHLGHGWHPYANFAYTRARDQATAGAPATRSLRVAPRKLNAGVTYAPGDMWSATLNVRAVSGVYFNSLQPTEWAAGHVVADAKLSVKLPFAREKWEAFLAGNNLTNKTYSEWNTGEYADRRTFTVGFNGKF